MVVVGLVVMLSRLDQLFFLTSESLKCRKKCGGGSEWGGGKRLEVQTKCKNAVTYDDNCMGLIHVVPK